MKMSDYFLLPISHGAIMRINEYCVVEENNDGVAPFDAAELAINNHDRLTEENAKLRDAFREVKRMLLQEREWRLEDCEVGGCEAKESLDTLSYNVDKLLNQPKEHGDD